MIKRIVSFLVSSLLLFSSLSIVSPAQAQGSQQLWALVISGSTGGTFSNDAQYMYHVLHDHYTFAGIRYLDVNTSLPGVDGLSTKSNVTSAITSWLHNRSTTSDIIFIYYSSHGGGYHTVDGWEGGRVEFASDEGNEVSEGNYRIANFLPPLGLRPWPLNVLVDYDGDGRRDDRLCDFDSNRYVEVDIDDDDHSHPELRYRYCADYDGDGQQDDIFADVGTPNRCDILINADTNGDREVDNWVSDGEDMNNDGYIVGVDLNGDVDRTDWVGIDESMAVQDGLYWDDELSSDLNTLSYAKLIFVKQGCLEEDLSCFSGGLIDDISASNRIIMTASNETSYSYGPASGSYSYWSEAFIDALHGQKTHYSNGVIHENPPVYVNADTNNDNHVSMWEAFAYAWYNDAARRIETPWIDDNGNRLPTYWGESDSLDSGGGLLSHDGLLAWETYFGFEELKSPDINSDHEVKMDDLVSLMAAFMTKPGDPGWNPECDINNDNSVDMADMSIAIDMYKKIYPTGLLSSLRSNKSSPAISVCPNGILTRKDETFFANITVTDVNAILGYDFELYYNTSVLKCNGVTLPAGHFLEPATPGNLINVRLEYDNEFNYTYGRVWVATVLLKGEPSKNGSGTLATINFTATAYGYSILDLYDTMLVNTSAMAVPHILIDGSVTVLPSLTILAQDQYSNSLTSGDVYIDDQLAGYLGSTVLVMPGTHTVFVNDFWEEGSTGYRYSFTHWGDSSVDNPRNMTIVEDTTITAYFNKKWCPGDADGDGAVDMADISLVIGCFGASRGDSGWDSRADLNHDDTIDMVDIGIVIDNFGNVYR